MERLRVGVIGVGFIGWLHARILHESFGADLAAVADADAKLEDQVERDFGCPFYTDYRHMLEQEDMGAVDICLPDSNHVVPSIDAARAGKHILLEKPMARTAEDCRKNCFERRLLPHRPTWSTCHSNFHVKLHHPQSSCAHKVCAVR